MKKNTYKRVISAFLATVMVFLMMPLSLINIAAEEETLPKMDYTPFMIESVDGRAVYNAQTADMCYDFYIKARNYIDGKISVIDELEEDIIPSSSKPQGEPIYANNYTKFASVNII